MMHPLYTIDREWCGWLESSRRVWNNQNQMVALAQNSHAWSIASWRWLGFAQDAFLMDRCGRIVACTPAAFQRIAVSVPGVPGVPGVPAVPGVPGVPAVHPPSPPVPISFPFYSPYVWSPLSFTQWYNQ